MQDPSIGRVVHFAFHNRAGNMVSRPAFIVNVHNRETIDLQVFTNGEDDGNDQAAGIWRRASVLHSTDDSPRVGFWSWPPRI